MYFFYLIQQSSRKSLGVLYGRNYWMKMYLNNILILHSRLQLVYHNLQSQLHSSSLSPQMISLFWKHNLNEKSTIETKTFNSNDLPATLAVVCDMEETVAVIVDKYWKLVGLFMFPEDCKTTTDTEVSVEPLWRER